jgi:glycosyltransferase involved in cell wall biosynthesis
MKIALIHLGFMYSGGGERTAIYESLLLRKRGHEVKCLSPAYRPEVCHPELIKEVKVEGLLPRLKVKIPLRDFVSLALSSFLVPFFTHKFKEFNLLLCHGQPATWITYIIHKRLGKQYFCYLHQPARFLYPRPVDIESGWTTKTDFALLEKIVRIAKPIIASFDHISVTGAKRILVNSEWISSWVKEIYGIQPIICSPGVDTDKFKPAQEKNNLETNEIKIKKPYLLSTNRHYPQKGMEYLIEIMPKILKSVDVRLVLTGEFTKHTQKLKTICKKLNIEDKVIFTGRVKEKDLIRLYQNADVYTYTSPQEDFGLGPLESMACGTPVVAWDYAGPKETVKNGVTGYLAKPYELDDFSEKVKELLLNRELNESMSRNGVEWVRSNHSWDRHVDMLESILIGKI